MQAAPVATAAALLAWRAQALRPSGALAAAAVGTLALVGAGWMGGAVLMSFFLPSTAISRFWPPPPSALDPKDDRRDAWQVLANGGMPVLALVAAGPAAHLAFLAGLCAAAGDTWATVVGAHSATPPRHVLSRRVVGRGESGGVTALGVLGSAAGAGLVALTAVPLVGWRGAGLASLIGVTGMLLDSALGAALQGRFRCDGCNRESERRIHGCGAATRLTGGYRWLTNDGVNTLMTTAATAAGWVAWGWCCSA